MNCKTYKSGIQQLVTSIQHVALSL